MTWTQEDHRRTQRVFIDKYESKIMQARRHFSGCPVCKESACQTWYNLHDKAESYRRRADSAGAAAYKLEEANERDDRDRPT